MTTRIWIYCFLILLATWFFCHWSNETSHRYAHRTKQGMIQVVSEASKLSTTGTHTSNLFLGFQQQSEAVGMMKALRLLVPEQDLDTICRTKVNQVAEEIKLKQEQLGQELLSSCPDFVPIPSQISTLAGFIPPTSPISPPSTSVTSLFQDTNK